VGQQCSAASTWRCLGSLVATTASDAKSTTYKKKNNKTIILTVLLIANLNITIDRFTLK
uniref:Uncharacterized protein n=1 Tax=Amphimedon queenslandica TaxID=400682 RepID=A0A1X7TXP7_AMPQE